MRKKRSLKKFESAKEMDRYLESHDLGDIFRNRSRMQYPTVKKVNLDLPQWLISELDFEAVRVGVSRQPLIKLWLVQKLEEERRKRQGPKVR